MMACVRTRLIRALALAMVCVAGVLSWSRPVVADDPCGNIPSDETWRFVMVVDGSGSMGGIWGDMVEAIKSQIATLPDGAELEIVVFSSETSNRRNRAALEVWKQPLDADARTAAMRWVDRLRPGGQTPLFHTLQQVLKAQESWLREDPRRRTGQVYIYTDGEDNPGFDSGGREATGAGKITQQDVQQVIDRIVQMEVALGVRFEGKEIAIGGHQGTGFRDIELIRQLAGQKIPIPVAVGIDLAAPQLEPVRDGRTVADLRVAVQCPQFLGGARARVTARSAEGFPINVQPSEVSLSDERIRLVLEPQATVARLRDGFDGTLEFEYVGGDPEHPISGTGSLRFGVEAERRIDLDPAAIQIRPGVVLRGKPVSLEYLRPLADATAAWTRADGGRIDGSDDWSASTLFEQEGDAVVTLVARRGDVVSDPIEVTIPVRDVSLAIGRTEDQPLTAGDQAGFEVRATGMQPIAYEWRVNGRPLLEDSGARVRTTLEQPGRVDVEVRGRLDLGDGFQPLTDWVSTSVEVGIRPDLHVRAPFKEPWGRPIEVQVLVDGDIERVRCSIVDRSTSAVVGDPVDAPVQTKALNEGKGVDRVADFMLAVPERSGVFLVRAEAVGRDGIVDDAEIELTTPALEVTLDDPPPIDRIVVGQPRHFTLSLGDRGAAVVKQVAWSVATDDGQMLPVEGIDEPSAIDARGLRVAEFDVLLPDDGSVSEGQTLLIAPVFTTAGGVRLEPAGAAPSWKLTAGYPGVTRAIVGGEGANVGWGETVVFSVDPADRIASIDWSVTGPAGTEPTRFRGDQFERTFDETPGEYRIRATVQPDIPNAAPIELETVRTITIEPAGASVEFPDGREGRGERLFKAVISITGSVRSGMLVLTSGEGDATEERRIRVDLKPGSGDQVVETSSGVYGPDAAGEIKVVLELETASGETRTIQAGTLNHRRPQEVVWFGGVAFVITVLMAVASKLLLGNNFLKWQLEGRVTGLDGTSRRTLPKHRSCRISWWNKSIRFPVRSARFPHNTGSDVSWFNDIDTVAELAVYRDDRLPRDCERFIPRNPGQTLPTSKKPDPEDPNRDVWLQLIPRSDQDDARAIEFTVNTRNDGPHWTVMVWIAVMVAGLAGVLAAWQHWMS